ncbi:response regulator [Brevundimonas naejangsanensis]|uniref:Response regulator n=1 Tax=Brevundimonas naejangsanensis TaxID=588932 RepID=A0A494RJR2_9CAUL|nr:response regulator [Brevundimonas naejangsanensis]AYG95253.1 response regulator [Brevundimonas naejangsanensis]
MSALGSIHVLLVDDNPNMRAIVAAMLKSVGVGRLTEAEDGAGALEALRREAIDIAIVDFRMKPMDGVAFTRAVRNDSPNPYLPVIMMTGHSERSRVTEARDAGVTEFVAKPVKAGTLLRRIEAVILRPRAFVRAPGYFGPDRRRTGTRDYAGPFRRADDPVVG